MQETQPVERPSADLPQTPPKGQGNANHLGTDPRYDGPYVELDPSLSDNPFKIKAAKIKAIYGDHKHADILFDGNTGEITHAVATAHVGVYIRGKERPVPFTFKIDLSENPISIYPTDAWPGGLQAALHRLRELILLQMGPHAEKEKALAEKKIEAVMAQQTKKADTPLIMPATEADANRMIAGAQPNREQRRGTAKNRRYKGR